MSPPPTSSELPGLEVVLDRLDYREAMSNFPQESPHAFVYHLTIRNGTDRKITLLGRKWIVFDAEGQRRVIEGDKIVGQVPVLEPGETFSYNSFHLTAGDSQAEGSFHGIDEFGNRIHVRIPALSLKIPQDRPAPDANEDD